MLGILILPPLEGRNVVPLTDNDPTGHEHVLDIARRLLGKASPVRILELPNLPEHGDVSDWLEAGHNLGESLDNRGS